MARFSYRYDIDGLRAMAVLAVLGFHVMPSRLPGGFVGVDVFFVISGFLITSILWRSFEAETFSMAAFYAKRIKRLFPALIVVLLVSAGIVYFHGLPDEVLTFSVSALAASFYVSNHYFLSISDYFDSDLELNPLLHTWSLSVEEQFYIIYPAILLLIFRHDRNRALRVLLLIGMVSLVLSEALLWVNKSASFFIAPSRFWQFMVGAVIALWVPKRPPSRAGMEMLSVLGLGAVALSFFYFSDKSAFPGVWALVPTLGTGAIIYAGQREGLFTSRILSLPVAKFFGKISYSLYLWHWPLIVFYKLQIEPEPSSEDRLLLIALSVLIGYLSWRFIEEPFRHVKFKQQTRRSLVAGALATMLVGLISYAFIASDGGRSRFSEEQLIYIDFLKYNADPFYRTDTCFLTSSSGGVASFDKEICIDYNLEKANVLIVGDSHSAQYYSALRQSMPSVAFSQVNASGCRPLMNYEGEERCTALMRMAFDEYAKEYSFDAIILAGRWEDEDMEAVAGTVTALSKVTEKVIVLGPILEYRQALPRLLARYDVDDNKLQAARFYAKIDELDSQMKSLVRLNDAEYYSILDAICPEEGCKVFASDGMPIQFDASHLTHTGAMEVVHALVEWGLLQDLQARAPS